MFKSLLLMDMEEGNRGLKHRHEIDNITLTCLVAYFSYLVSAFFGNTMFYTAPYLFIFLGMANPFPSLFHKELPAAAAATSSPESEGYTTPATETNIAEKAP